jgi:hypothetical protein
MAGESRSGRWVQLVLMGLTLAGTIVSALVSARTAAAVTQVKVELIQEMNQSFVRRPEFEDLRGRFNIHCDREAPNVRSASR